MPNLVGETIASHLRNACRPTQNGKFEEDDNEISAIYLLQLGKHYLSQGDGSKSNFLFSAVLFAAAQQRSTEAAIEAQSLFEQLWKKLLNKCGSQNRNESVVTITSDLKRRLSEDRDLARHDVSKIPVIADSTPEDQIFEKEKQKIEIAQHVFSDITTRYIDFMAHISQKCCEIIFGSELPCNFAHVALGSVARSEVTPFSDFESIILLENSIKDEENETEIMEQFRWYIVMFQVLILSLGETPIRLLGIPLLNDFASGERKKDWFYDRFTKCGIQFDSNLPGAGIHPLSNKTLNRDVELIATVDSMIGYLDDDYTQPNGYHLASTLWVSRLVAGCASLHLEFTGKVSEKLASKPDVVTRKIKETMEYEDALDEFTGTFGERNIKRLIYRSITATISHLGTLFELQPGSCYDVIDQLLEKRKITSEVSHQLKYAVALTCELRNKLYLQENQQVSVSRLGKGGPLYSVIEGVGRSSVCDFYDITHSLWLSLHPYIVAGKPFSKLNFTRNRTTCLFLSIRASLFDNFEEAENLQLPPLDLNSVNLSRVYVVKDVIKDLIEAVEALQELVPEETHVDMAKLKEKFSKLLVAFGSSKNVIRACQRNISVPENLYVSSLFECNDKAYAKYSNAMRKVIFRFRHLLSDSSNRFLTIFPDFLIFNFFVADFVSNLNSLFPMCCQQVDSASINKTLQQLDEACELLIRFQHELPKFEEKTTNEVYEPKADMKFMTNRLDYGIYTRSNMHDGIRRVIKTLQEIRNNFLAFETCQIAFQNINRVINSSLAPPEDWFAFFATWRKAAVRDSFIMIANLFVVKGKLLRRQNKFEIARKAFCDALDLFRKNPRPKFEYQTSVAKVLRYIGKCYLESFRYGLAIRYFKDELQYRNDSEELSSSPYRKAIGKNHYYQALCLEGENTSVSLEAAEKHKLKAAEFIASL